MPFIDLSNLERYGVDLSVLLGKPQFVLLTNSR